MPDDIRTQAQAAFATGMACSQAVAVTFAERVGCDADTAAKAALGFGGGMGRQGHTCGAVTGGILVLGLAYGQQTDGAWNKVDVYAKVREFCDRFGQCQGGLECRELLGLDVADPAQAAQATEQGLFKTICPEAVGCAAALLDEMLAD